MFVLSGSCNGCFVQKFASRHASVHIQWDSYQQQSFSGLSSCRIPFLAPYLAKARCCSHLRLTVILCQYHEEMPFDRLGWTAGVCISPESMAIRFGRTRAVVMCLIPQSLTGCECSFLSHIFWVFPVPDHRRLHSLTWIWATLFHDLSCKGLYGGIFTLLWSALHSMACMDCSCSICLSDRSMHSILSCFKLMRSSGFPISVNLCVSDSFHFHQWYINIQIYFTQS